MKYKIEKNVPLPTIGGGKYAKYPLGDMKVGDSFFTDDIPSDRLRPVATVYGKRTGRKYSVRKVEGGLRCWRVE